MKTAISLEGNNSRERPCRACDVRSPVQQEHILCGSTTRTTHPDLRTRKRRSLHVNGRERVWQRKKERNEREKLRLKLAENDRNAHNWMTLKSYAANIHLRIERAKWWGEKCDLEQERKSTAARTSL
jgi:hypothetical protein